MSSQHPSIIKEEHESSSSSNQRCDQSEGLYEVQKIVKKRIKNSKPQYMIKWIGYPKSQNTWEPLEHLTEVQQMVKQFDLQWAKLNVKPKKVTNQNQTKTASSKKYPKSNLNQIDQSPPNTQNENQLKLPRLPRLQNKLTTQQRKIQVQKNVQKMVHFSRSNKIQFETQQSKIDDQQQLIHQSFSQKSESQMSFLLDNDEQSQNFQKVSVGPNRFFINPLQKLQNLNDSPSCTRTTNCSSLSKNYSSLISLLRDRSLSLIQNNKGTRVIQISSILCQVQILNSDKNKMVTECLLPLEIAIDRFPKLIDLKIEQIIQKRLAEEQ